MPISLHIRELPDSVHESLQARARIRGMSLRQYTMEVLADHCQAPTVGEWLAEIRRLPPAQPRTPAAEALSQAREAEDIEVLTGRSGG